MSADVFDVDAELLAMAGDSSDDDDASEMGEVTQTIEHPRSPSPSQEPKQSVEEPPSIKRGVAQKVRKRGRKRDHQREIEEDLDNLADSPSPGASLASLDMAESGSDADAPASPVPVVEDGPLYPLEGRFTDADDRKYVLGLPEIQRESILAERAAEALRREQDLQLKKLIAQSQAQTSKSKRKAAAAGLDDEETRKSSRAKKSTALDDYKKAREAKGAERTGRKLDAGRGRRRSSRSVSSSSDRDADGESEVEWAEPSSHSRISERDEPPADLKDFDRCRLGRGNFAQVCFYPNFEETIKGCFARVSVGPNHETGEHVYRMTQIKGFKLGRPYQLEGQNGKTFQCDQYIVVALGTDEKPWPFSSCSNGHFTEVEFQYYKNKLENAHVRVPRKAWLSQKVDDINKFLSPVWDDAALKTKFANQTAMAKRTDPVNIAKAKREAVLKRKQEAEEIEDAEEIAKCDAELAALENNLANGAPTKPKASPFKTEINPYAHQDRMAALNAKNRGKNSADVRKALLEERKKLYQERERVIAEQKARQAEEERKKAEALLQVPGDDLFGEGSDRSRAGTPMSGTSTPRMRRSRAGTPINGVGIKKEKSGLGLLGKKKPREDDLGDIDFGIDVEI